MTVISTENRTGDSTRASKRGFGVVGIGASAGGLEAFTALLDALPDDTGLAFVLVPHLDPDHASLMAQLLATHTGMPVENARNGVLARPNRVFVIPPGKFMTIDGGVLHLTAPPGELATATGRQTAIDTFLRSLALDMQHRAIGIVLSGTSNHGTPGLREIRDRGGLSLVQDPETARFPQMPRSAITAGVADQILSPADIAGVLTRYAETQRASGAWTAQAPGDADREKLTAILAILRARTKYDFRGYRKNMLLRRVRRRMGLCQLTTLADYIQRLHQDPAELGALFRDMLIGVTGFFRDPSAFEVLEQRVIGDLAERAGPDRPVRVWVAGCATGEEAYSIAMLLIEAFAQRKRAINLQLFATDLDENALEIARQAVYPKSILADVSPERIKRFFITEDAGHYRVNKELRESVVFAPQNLIADAPFSRLDLISCRNLLIYLEPEIQRQVISLFHFALRQDGYLLLGPSESVGPHTDLFETLSKQWRLFRRTGAIRPTAMTFPTGQQNGHTAPSMFAAEPGAHPLTAAGRVAERMLLEEYGPAAILVSQRFEILYFFGATVNYLELPTGRPTLYLMDLLRRGLRTRVRAACHQASRDQTTVNIEDARVERNGRFLRVQVRVRALTSPKHMSGMLLISFIDADPPVGKTGATEQMTDAVPLAEIALAQQLELELKTTREELQSSVEELESANEELKASNEEAMSANEELQSANEELETSKEELQSLNEELTTVNNQLEEKVRELERSNDDMSNLFASTDLATVFLDTQMRIQRFTPQTAKLLNLRPGDSGRPLAELSPNFRDDDLLPDARQVLERLSPVEKEIATADGAGYLRRILPYRTRDNRIEGVVITFVDITLRSQAEAAIRASEERYRILFERSPMCLMEQDWSGVRRCLEARRNASVAQASTDPHTHADISMIDWLRAHPQQAAACRDQIQIKAINQAMLCLLGADNAEQVSAAIQRFFPLESMHELQGMLEQLLHGRSGVHEFAIRTLSGQRIPALLHTVPVFGYEQSLERVLMAVIDISHRRELERQIIDTSTREQERIGQEIHDGLGQQLTAVTMLATALANKLNKAQQPEASEARELARQVQQALADSKGITQGLAPVGVAPERLADALSALAAQVRHSSGVHCELSHAHQPPITDPVMAANLYRIAQEAVSNAVRHGKPTRIEIRLEQQGNLIRLSVRDDGEWKATPRSGPGGLGLHIMSYRAGILGGKLSVGPEPDGGTLALCEIPLRTD